jgi:hypothetical protein
VSDTRIDGKLVFTGEFSFTMKEIEVFMINIEINPILFSFPQSVPRSATT